MPTEIGKLIVSFEAETARLDAANRKVVADLKKTEAQAKETTKAVENTFKGGTGAPGASSKSFAQEQMALLRTDVEKLKPQIAGLSAETSGFMSSLIAAGPPIAAFAVALGLNVGAVIALHKGLLDLSLDTAKQQSQIANLARQYKVSTDAIQAAQIIAAKSGRDLSEVLKDMDNQLPSEIAHFRELGLIMGEEEVKAGKRLEDELIQLGLQWDMVKNKSGAAINPALIALINQLNATLQQTQGAAEGAALGIGLIATYLTSNLQAAVALAMVYLDPLIQALNYINSFKPAAVNPGGQNGLQMLNQLGQSWRAQNATLPVWGRTTGGGGRGGARAAAPRVDPGLGMVRDLLHEIDSLTSWTRYAKLAEIQQQLLGESFNKTTDSVKRQAMQLAVEIDVIKEANAEFNKFVSLVQELGDKGEAGFRRLRSAAKDFAATIQDLGGKILNAVPDFAKTGGVALKGASLGGLLESDQFLGSFGKVDITGQQQSQFAKFKERMRDLGFELTDIWANSVSDGFNRGIESGLQTLSLGLLRIVEDVFLRRLAVGLADLLGGLGSSGGGGSWGGLFKAVLGGVASGAAGGVGGKAGTFSGAGGGFAGKFAMGGNIPMGQYGIVHDNERVYATPFGAKVVPGSGSGEVHNHYSINLPARGDNYSTPKSRRQAVRDIMRGIEGANA